MGCFCDRCHVLCGGMTSDNFLSQYEDWDLCPDCLKIVRALVHEHINKAEKLNKIGGVHP